MGKDYKTESLSMVLRKLTGLQQPKRPFFFFLMNRKPEEGWRGNQLKFVVATTTTIKRRTWNVNNSSHL